MPYPNGEAIGYAFAVNEKSSVPPSLQVIRNEIITSGVERDSSINIDSLNWKTLKGWRQQGVFLLNTALTVQERNAGSHLDIWQWFTREIVKIISLHNNPVWLLWGSKAKSYKGLIHGYYKWQGNFIAPNYNYVLEADHPAAELYRGSSYKFTGCNHFKQCNQILKVKKQPVINW